MSSEVAAMIDLRHQAEQRGHYSPLGRLLSIETQHGLIEFPAKNGMQPGPDLAVVVCEENECDGRSSAELVHGLIVLGAWTGLPALRYNSTVPCPKCQHSCDICDKGKKLCEGLGCGGRGWIDGPFLSCPGPGCHAETGKYNPSCWMCLHSPVRGHLAEKVTCKMCEGTGKMTCSRCRGAAKYSTGIVNGATDFRLKPCAACAGTGWKGKFIEQDLAKFTNAVLTKKAPQLKSSKQYLALGPIYSFTLQTFGDNRPRAFRVGQDEKGDYLFLLVPANGKVKPQKAYLVGGLVSEAESKVA